MSAPVTEAHRKLVAAIIRDLSIDDGAQLIADSEERACDQLRAEVERLKHGTVAQFKDAFIDELKRENTELREWQAGVIANEKSHHAERKDAIARAERAEAELATERARLDWLLLDNLTRFDDSISHRTAIDAAMQNGEK